MYRKHALKAYEDCYHRAIQRALLLECGFGVIIRHIEGGDVGDGIREREDRADTTGTGWCRHKRCISCFKLHYKVLDTPNSVYVYKTRRFRSHLFLSSLHHLHSGQRRTRLCFSIKLLLYAFSTRSKALQVVEVDTDIQYRLYVNIQFT